MIPIRETLRTSNPFMGDWRSNLDLFRIRRAFIETDDAPGEWEIALLHGWHSLYEPMRSLENELRRQNPTARLWRVSYDSHWKTFRRSAREINARFRARGVDPQKTLLVGYSMGGIVARSMVEQGFAARGVLCLCSPHLGPALHIPFGDLGSLSIFGPNLPLKRLNRGHSDIARRSDYFFQAITFTDASGFCRHDRIVSQRSALGVGLRGVGKRHCSNLRYEGIAPGPHPHLQGLNPEKVPEALAWCREKLSQSGTA